MATESARTSLTGVRNLPVGSDAGSRLDHERPRTPRHSTANAPASIGSWQWLVDAPRVLLLGVLAYAPWAYGCTREWSLAALNVALLVVVSLWIAGCLARRCLPRIHPILLVIVVLLLLQGWWMTVNSGWSYDAQFAPHPRPNLSSRLPGSIDHAVSLPSMLGLSGMLGIICFAADLAGDRRWRKLMLRTMALVGVSLVILGLSQKVTHSPGIFWQQEGHEATFFGSYRYHANAGTFINLTWPLVAVAFAQALRRERRRGRQLLWGGALVICLTGALANTSRASGAITVFMLLAWGGVTAWRRFRRPGDPINPGMAAGAVMAFVTLIFLAVAVGGLDATLRRWGQFDREISLSNSRLMGALVCVDMLPQSGWLGFGPGTFQTAFPFFNKDTSESTSGVWLQAHQDYLQTLVEWGWLGAFLWACLGLGALAWVIWSLVRHRGFSSRSERLAATGMTAALLATFTHAVVDFPLQIASLQLYTAILVGICWHHVMTTIATRRGSESA